MTDPPLSPIVATLLSLALVVVPVAAHADPGPTPIPLYYYGTEGDGHLGRETAFATWWSPPQVPLTVCPWWPGIALNGWPPGARVRITVVGLPRWAVSWPELASVIGNSTIAYVADRPGGEYGDAWLATFQQLAPLWVGKLYVMVESADSALSKRRNYE